MKMQAISNLWKTFNKIQLWERTESGICINVMNVTCSGRIFCVIDTSYINSL